MGTAGWFRWFTLKPEVFGGHGGWSLSVAGTCPIHDPLKTALADQPKRWTAAADRLIDPHRPAGSVDTMEINEIQDLRNHSQDIVDPNQLHRANEEFAALLTEAAYADLSVPQPSGWTGIELCNHVMNAQRDVLLQLRQCEQANPPEHVRSDWVQDAVGARSLGGDGFGDELARRFRRAARSIEQDLARARGQGDGMVSHVDEVGASHAALIVEATRRLAEFLELDVTTPTHEPDDPAAFIHEWAKAIVTNDVAQMAPFTSDDWVLVDQPGVITRETFHRVVADGLLRHMAMAHEVLDVSRYGPVAVVRTHGTNTAIFQGTAIEADEWTTNILVTGDDGWRCVLTQLTPRPTPS